MATVVEWLTLEERSVVPAVLEAAKNLVDTNQQVVLDFASVRRLDAGALQAMEEFASKAATKRVKVVLRGVNVDVYKVLKLVKLAPRFSFVSCERNGAAEFES